MKKLIAALAVITVLTTTAQGGVVTIESQENDSTRYEVVSTSQSYESFMGIEPEEAMPESESRYQVALQSWSEFMALMLESESQELIAIK